MSRPDVPVTVDDTAGALFQVIVDSPQVVLDTPRTWKPVVWFAVTRTRSSVRLIVPDTPATWKRR